MNHGVLQSTVMLNQPTFVTDSTVWASALYSDV